VVQVRGNAGQLKKGERQKLQGHRGRASSA
jgi:hypothetical protein